MSGFPQCPLPPDSAAVIELADGGGGRRTQRLLEDLILPAFSNAALNARHDGATLPGAPRLAFTTDSYVVDPLFFPGGDIGELAVYGAVNDLAMCGARPMALSAGLILEEGLPIEVLRRVVASMQRACAAAGVPLVTGDTKVVGRGKGDAIFINTAGIGEVVAPEPVRPDRVRPGDVLILSGDLGRHGIAVLSAREGFELEGAVASDAAPLWTPVRALLAAGVDVHCLRDLTRGGLASALNEIAAAAGLGVAVQEAAIPVDPGVQGACELLGLDPHYVACEGRFLAFVAPADAARALAALREIDVSSGAAIVGSAVDGPSGQVVLETALGSRRPLDMLSGEQLPRIC
ncbi:MAG: hydrogenase expression/formation protein HypE [Bryobacteraceae bacterium]